MAKLAALADDFAGSALDPAKWTVLAGSVAVAAHQAVADAAHGNTVITSARTYDMAGSEFSVKVAPVGTATGSRVSVRIAGPDGALAIIAAGGLITFRITRSGVDSDVSAPYGPATDTYWRIRESMGQALFATSPSRLPGSWTTHRQDIHAISLSAVTATLSVGSSVSSGWGHGPFGHGPFGG